MAIWERKDAEVLADAIGKHRRSNPDQVDSNALLAAIEKAVDAHSNTVATTAEDVRRFRGQVCAICRGANLYECDVEEGWSQNCAFVITNTTSFGSL
jgi:hypothetical protein